MSMSRRSFFVGLAALSAAIAAEPLPVAAAYLPAVAPILNALDYGVTGDGSTNDSAALLAFLTLASTKGAVAFLPGNRTYDLGNSSTLVPDGVTVLCGRSATIRRSAYPVGGFFGGIGAAGAMIRLGNRCRWSGGTLTTPVTSTTSTSNTVGTGSKSWTVPAGLDIHVNDFMRGLRTSAQSNYVEGLVTAYSGTTLTINCTFSNGSGTFTDWTFTQGAVYACPIVLSAVQQSTVENVEVTGLWYTGIVLDGGSPVAATTTKYCTVRDCVVTGAQNRAFYMYQDIARCSLINCSAEGTASSPIDYGFNYNAANPSVANNSIRDSSTIGCQTNLTLFQGFGIGDNCNELSFDSCVAANVTNTAGNGFSVFFANVASPQFINISNCHGKFCGNAGFFVAGASWVHFNNCQARSNTVAGFKIDQSTNNSTENMLTGCEANANGIGIHIANAGTANTIITGCRAVNNTTNFTNAGTGTVGAPTTA